jgi:hypothetical protein
MGNSRTLSSGNLHGISKQGVAEFAVRNKAEIAQVREAAVQGLAEELAGVWGADRPAKLDELMRIYAVV